MLHDCPLGEKTVYIETYSPHLLFPVPRSYGREKIGINQESLPFKGVDFWNGFELSWLNHKGKPVVALAEFIFSCENPFIVESKSFKLYLNSFNQTNFDSIEEVRNILERDLAEACQGDVKVNLRDLNEILENKSPNIKGTCLDDIDVEIHTYEVDPGLLQTSEVHASESLYSHLLKSNCLATGQPDWGTLYISYIGPKIDHESLLKYIISFRRHSGFAEHCVEQIYQDIMTHCRPNGLSVYARYTRRGGLDINPFRSNFEEPPINVPFPRQ